MTLQLISAACLAFATISSAGAATISSITKLTLPGATTGSVGPVGATPAPNNDDSYGPSPNVIPYSLFVNSAGTMETEFALAQSGGTTEYRFTQTLFNNIPGAAWQGFKFELGFGTGADFTLSPLADLLMFDAFENNSTATANAFNLTVDEMKVIEWGGGKVSRFQSAVFSFAIDVPDDLADLNPQGLNRFTLRQTPIVAGSAPAPAPEPATAMLFGLALVAVGIRGRSLAHARMSRTTSPEIPVSRTSRP